MNQREKLLAIVTGGVLTLFVLWFVYDWIDGTFASRTAQIDAVRADIDKQDTVLRRGRRAGRAIAQYESQSLPADANSARSLYQEWLWDWLQAAELREINVTPISEVGRGSVFRRITFKVTGQGDLQSVSNALLGFYQADHLHKIRQAAVKPVEDSRDLQFAMTIEALSLPGSINEGQLSKAVSPRLVHIDTEAMFATILDRNLFAPPNQPPRFASTGMQRVELGDALRLTFKAIDPDTLDKLQFELVTGPEGATLSSDGSLRWQPQELGEYQVTARVIDSGTPSRSAEQSLTVNVVEKPPRVVVEPPAPKPRFDNAKHAFLTGTIEVDGQWQVWIELRTDGKMLKLREGDRIDIGSVTGLVHKISTDHAEVTTDDKQRLLLALGEPLSEATRLPATEL